MEINSNKLKTTTLSKSLEDMKCELKNLYEKRKKTLEEIEKYAGFQRQAQYFIISIIAINCGIHRMKKPKQKPG